MEVLGYIGVYFIAYGLTKAILGKVIKWEIQR